MNEEKPKRVPIRFFGYFWMLILFVILAGPETAKDWNGFWSSFYDDLLAAEEEWR